MKIRKIEKEDIDKYYEIKCEDSNIFWTGWDTKPKYENICKFINNCIENEKNKLARKVYLVEDDDMNVVGYMYIDPVDENIFDLPVAVKNNSTVKASDIIKQGLEMAKQLGFTKLIGYIREDNVFSMKAYKKNGVTITDEYIEKYIPMLDKKVKMFKTIKEI